MGGSFPRATTKCRVAIALRLRAVAEQFTTHTPHAVFQGSIALVELLIAEQTRPVQRRQSTGVYLSLHASVNHPSSLWLTRSHAIAFRFHLVGLPRQLPLRLGRG